MLEWLSQDGKRLFAARIVRSFAFGFLAVGLGSYLESLRYGGAEVGIVLSIALGTAAGVGILVALRGDAWGRRRVLMAFSAGMVVAGAILLASSSFLVILLAVAIGTVSPTGGDIGPFVSLEQAMLPQASPPDRRTDAFALYNLAATLSASLGALFSGLPAFAGRFLSLPEVPYGVLFATYAILGLLALVIYRSLSPSLEPQSREPARKMSPPTRRTVSRLAGLFAADSFGGGFVLQSFVVFWFAAVWHADGVTLAGVFFAANLLASLSFLLAARLAAKFGLLNVMVFTHIPSSVFLILVPLMPSFPLALAMYFARMSLSQMDVPTRQSYTMTVVPPEDRTAAASVTTVGRNIGQSASPWLGGIAFAVSPALPFGIGGAIKIAYDLALYVTFRRVPLDTTATVEPSR